jgi:hypothetical protein
MTDIVPVEHSTEVAVSAPADVPTEWVAAMRLAGRIHHTEFVPKAMRGRPEVVLACILYGQELGIGPMQSLQGVQIIEGTPGAKPELMRSLVMRAGHTFQEVEVSAERVTLYGKRRDTGVDATVSWTIAEARAAGLAGKAVWKSYPEDMLYARATSRLCRRIFGDVVKGLVYSPEEAATIGGVEWEPDPTPDTTAIIDHLDDEGEPAIDSQFDVDE